MIIEANGKRHFDRMYFHEACEQKMETFIKKREEHVQDAIHSARRVK